MHCRIQSLKSKILILGGKWHHRLHTNTDVSIAASSLVRRGLPFNIKHPPSPQVSDLQNSAARHGYSHAFSSETQGNFLCLKEHRNPTRAHVQNRCTCIQHRSMFEDGSAADGEAVSVGRWLRLSQWCGPLRNPDILGDGDNGPRESSWVENASYYRSNWGRSLFLHKQSWRQEIALQLEQFGLLTPGAEYMTRSGNHICKYGMCMIKRWSPKNRATVGQLTQRVLWRTVSANQPRGRVSTWLFIELVRTARVSTYIKLRLSPQQSEECRKATAKGNTLANWKSRPKNDQSHNKSYK